MKLVTKSRASSSRSVGFVLARFALDVGLDIAFLKNEAIVDRIVRNSFSLMHLEEPGGLRHDPKFLPLALLLHLAELLERLVVADGDAMFVEGEVNEGLALLAKHFGHGEGGVDLVVFGVYTVRLFRDAQSEHIGFEGSGAIQAPREIGYGLGELNLGGVLRLVLIVESFAVALVGDEVVGRQDDGLAGESVTEGVEGGALFAGLGARAGRFTSVFPTGFGAVIEGGSIRDF